MPVLVQELIDPSPSSCRRVYDSKPVQGIEGQKVEHAKAQRINEHTDEKRPKENFHIRTIHQRQKVQCDDDKQGIEQERRQIIDEYPCRRRQNRARFVVLEIVRIDRHGFCPAKACNREHNNPQKVEMLDGI